MNRRTYVLGGIVVIFATLGLVAYLYINAWFDAEAADRLRYSHELDNLVPGKIDLIEIESWKANIMVGTRRNRSSEWISEFISSIKRRRSASLDGRLSVDIYSVRILTKGKVYSARVSRTKNDGYFLEFYGGTYRSDSLDKVMQKFDANSE